jgi:Mn2+/Fe2+ NRAMP family transporter
VSNIVTIGADILAVSAALGMLSNVAFQYWVLPVTVAIWYLMVFQSFKILKAFLLMTIPFMLSYVLAAILAKPDWGQVFGSIVFPQLTNLPAGYFVAAVGIMGTTITPYLLFWHTREQVEERKTKRQILSELKHEDIVTSPGLIFSQIITLFIMIAGASALFSGGQGIATPADAARALEPVGGSWATVLFAIGIISSGVIALPVLSGSTAYALGEALNLKHESLNDKPRRAIGFYVIISLSLLAGLVMTMLNLDPIKSLYYSQILAGLLAPLLVGVVIILANKKEVVGQYGASRFENFFATLAMVFIVASAIFMFVG